MGWRSVGQSDIGIRAAGASLLIVALLGISQATSFVRTGPRHPPTLFEVCLIVLGFAAFSIGGACLTHGHGLLEPVEVSQRWQKTGHDRHDRP